MIKCIIFRHGQTDWNKKELILGHTDVPINETGKLQAVQIKEKLLKMPTPDAVFSSDLKRCVQTAKIVYPMQKINKTRLLREINFGIYEGKNRWEVRKNDYLFSEILNNYNHPLHLFTPFPKGESSAQAFQRLLRFLLQIAEKYNNKCVALFTHGDLIELIFEINNMQIPEIKHGSFFCCNFDTKKMTFHDFKF